MQDIYVKIPVNTCHGWELHRARISYVRLGQVELRDVNGGVELLKPQELASIVDAFPS